MYWGNEIFPYVTSGEEPSLLQTLIPPQEDEPELSSPPDKDQISKLIEQSTAVFHHENCLHVIHTPRSGNNKIHEEQASSYGLHI
jgi:hypothetical protein